MHILYKRRWTVILNLHNTDSTHTGVDHVWSLCPCCLDCLEDIHSSFNCDSLNFRHTSDEDTTARHAITSGKTDNHVQPTRTALSRGTAAYNCAHSLAHNQNRSRVFLRFYHFSHHFQQGSSRRWASWGPTFDVVQDHLHRRTGELHVCVRAGCMYIAVTGYITFIYLK